MAGMTVRSSQVTPKVAPIEIWKLHKELQSRKISKSEFAKALGVSYNHIDGKGTFPPEKVVECWQLLDNWGSKKG